MSLLEILKLVGFATGAALHLYIASLIWSRRLGSRQRLSQPEGAFLILGLCLGVWFLGNLLTTLQHVLLLGGGRLTPALRAWDTITMTGISVLPAALLHAHIAFWSAIDNYRLIKPRQVNLAAVFLYAPLLALPYAIYRIWTGEYRPFLVDLRPLLVPYSVWFLFALWASAVVDWALKDRFGEWEERERLFFKRLAAILFVIGALEFVVIAVLRSGADDYSYVFYVLLSLLPTFTVAYHVYRYKLVEVVIKTSLVYAGFAILFFAVYTYIVRYIDQLLVQRFDVRPGVIAAILLLGMVALAGPAVRVIEKGVKKLFAREVGLYRDIVRQVSTGASGFGELTGLLHYTEQIVAEGLDLPSVRIIALDSKVSGPERALADKMVEWKADVIEHDELLSEMAATTAYALKRDETLVGVMLIFGEARTLTSEKRAILDVLAGQIAIELETCRLIEEKVRLERALSNRERLATLGQMAATIAHEVKNPLSSIKSIVQVMREKTELAAYDRDLELIVSEIDRLNRTVSQLLAFSRPSNSSSPSASLAEVVESSVTLLRNEAHAKDVSVTVVVDSDLVLAGAQAAALRETLSNLIVNAIQACDPRGEVIVAASVEDDSGAAARGSFARSSMGGVAGREKAIQNSARTRDRSRLIVSVTDTGPGIPEQNQQRVFEPFYTTKARGTGLGLAIVQRRIAELGGLVELKSPFLNDRGSRFRLILPLADEPQMRVS